MKAANSSRHNSVLHPRAGSPTLKAQAQDPSLDVLCEPLRVQSADPEAPRAPPRCPEHLQAPPVATASGERQVSECSPAGYVRVCCGF